MRRTFLLFVLALLALVGCGPRWNIIVQANPNPLNGARNFALDGVHFENLRVGGKTEGEYLSGKNPDQQASFQADKTAFQQRFGESVVGHAEGLVISGMPPKDEKTFVIVPYITFFEPGFYAGVAKADTTVEIDVKITSSTGAVIDEFTVRSRISATLTSPSSGDRLRKAGDDLGGVIAKYLKVRSGLTT